MSQDDLAEAAGTTRRTIGSLERGHTNPQPGTLGRILKVLGLDAAPAFDQEVETYLSSIIGPLLQQVPAAQRGEALRRVVLELSRAIAQPTTPSPSAGGEAFGLEVVSEN